MLHIALIDDQTYGIPQIEKLHEGEEFELEYFETFESFKEFQKTFDIAYLDYYLDKDGITGDTVVKEVKKQAKKVVGFSSVSSCSEKIKAAGADAALVKI